MPMILLFTFAYWASLSLMWKIFLPILIVVIALVIEKVSCYAIATVLVLVFLPFNSFLPMPPTPVLVLEKRRRLP